MKSVYKVAVFGAPKVGKTTILEEAIYGSRYRLTSPYEPTLEDIYCALVDTDKKTREKVYFYDYAGMGPHLDVDLIKMCLSFCDACILVYSIDDRDSYNMMKQIKKNIDQLKEKKDIAILVFANKIDKFNGCVVDPKESYNWAAQEKVKLYEITATDRKTINEIFTMLVSKITVVPHKSSFTSQLRKSKTGGIPLEL